MQTALYANQIHKAWEICSYRKFPKYWNTPKICCNHSKIWTMWLYHRVMSPNDADGMANSVDPDQTAPLGAVWSGSALFAQAYLSENLGSLRYKTLRYIVAILYSFVSGTNNPSHEKRELYVMQHEILQTHMCSQWALSWEKTVLGMFDQVRLKPACSAIVTSKNLENSATASRGIILSRQRTTKVLIRLCWCAGWSVPLLFLYGMNSSFCDVALCLKLPLLLYIICANREGSGKTAQLCRLALAFSICL